MLSLQTIHPDTLALLSLTYFADADPQPMPFMFKPVDWNVIKGEIQHHVEQYNNKHS